MPPFKRRDFIKIMGAGAAAGGAAAWLPGIIGNAGAAEFPEGLYDMPMQGQARILHTTDVHGQLFPVFFREPNVNLGIGPAFGKVPHVVGRGLLEQMGFEEGSAEAYAYTYLDFNAAAAR